METDRIIELTKLIALNQPEPEGLTDEERQFWARTSAEVADMKARGLTPDLIYEI